MGTRELLEAAAQAASEEQVPVAGGSVTVRRAAAKDVIAATRYATSAGEDRFRLAIAALSVVDGDERPLVDPDGSLDRGIAELGELPGGLQIAICGASMRVNGFAQGN